MSELSNPIPQGNYKTAVRTGNLVFSAGMTSRKDGVLIMTGKVSPSDNLEMYKEAVILAVKNALTGITRTLDENEKILQIASINVYINAEHTFTKHSKLADFASNYLYDEYGEAGIAARTSIGVYSLPGNAPIEIQLIANVG